MSQSDDNVQSAHEWQQEDLRFGSFAGCPTALFYTADGSMAVSICTSPMLTSDPLLPRALSFPAFLTSRTMLTTDEVAQHLHAVIDHFDLSELADPGVEHLAVTVKGDKTHAMEEGANAAGHGFVSNVAIMVEVSAEKYERAVKMVQLQYTANIALSRLLSTPLPPAGQAH